MNCCQACVVVPTPPALIAAASGVPFTSTLTVLDVPQRPEAR
jgi:hypothetical protein